MDNHDTILGLDKADESEYMRNNMYEASEDAYVAVKTKINSYLVATKPATIASDGEPTYIMKQIQLPKIDLPKFSGDLLKWEAFRDLVRAFVHNVSGLSASQKLQYLKASLEGEAAVVDNIDISIEGYMTV